MATGAIFTNTGKNTVLNRLLKSSPDYTNLSRFGIGTGTTTPAVTDTGNTTPITAWNGGSDYKNFESGYPTFDTSNRRATWRGLVTATQANSNTIAEFADFNTDGSPRVGAHVVVNGIVKTSSIQVFVDFTYRMV